jgi:hypothetical protein
LLYVMFIWRRQSRLEIELRLMEARLKEVRAEIEAHASSKPRSAQ